MPFAEPDTETLSPRATGSSANHPCAPPSPVSFSSKSAPFTAILTVFMPYGTGRTARYLTLLQEDAESDRLQRVIPSARGESPCTRPSLAVRTVPSSKESVRQYTFSVRSETAGGSDNSKYPAGRSGYVLEYPGPATSRVAFVAPSGYSTGIDIVLFVAVFQNELVSGRRNTNTASLFASVPHATTAQRITENAIEIFLMTVANLLFCF